MHICILICMHICICVLGSFNSRRIFPGVGNANLIEDLKQTDFLLWSSEFTEFHCKLSESDPYLLQTIQTVLPSFTVCNGTENKFILQACSFHRCFEFSLHNQLKKYSKEADMLLSPKELFRQDRCTCQVQRLWTPVRRVQRL